MLEAGRTLACIAAILLVVAAGAYLKLGRTPLFRRVNGRLALTSAIGQTAAQLLVAAAALSAAAAALAVIAWFVR